jgi:plastocyanin
MQILNGPTANIKVGTIVRWINEDNLKPHGVEATDPSDGTWISGGTNSMIPFGAPLDITFDKVGNYDYRTTFQPQVYGKIAVTA